MSADGKKSFIENVSIIFSKYTLKEIGKTQLESLVNTKDNITAKLLDRNGNIKIVSAYDLKKGNIIIVEAGDIIPSDGEVIEGLALVDESAITGESVPVIKESCGDFNSVINGTRIVNNWLKIKVISAPSKSFYNKTVTPIESTAI